MVLNCLDYLSRHLVSSNIRRIVDHANQIFFRGDEILQGVEMGG